MALPKCLDCPVCHRQPMWYASGDAEDIQCPWDEGCPEDSFDFSTGYRPALEAIAAWNDAVLAYAPAPTTGDTPHE